MAGRRQIGPRPRAAVVALPARAHGLAPRLLGIVPSACSLLVGFALLVLAAGAYLAARTTSAFALRAVEVRGAPAPVAREVRATLRPLLGTSLLALPRGAVERSLAAVPTVATARYDSASPDALVITVVPARPAAVLPPSSPAWLVSARGRVLRSLPRRGRPALPRVWVPRGVPLSPGAHVQDPDGARAIRALVPALGQPLPRIRSVRSSARELTFELASGAELRLGDDSALPLKLAIARRVLAASAQPPAYLDVSVPGRPVAARTLNSQLEVEGCADALRCNSR